MHKKLPGMLRGMLVIFGGLSLAGTLMGQQPTPTAPAVDSHRAVADVKARYQRSIDFLAAGIKNNWTEETFQSAFVGKQLPACVASIHQLLQPAAIWDEKLHRPFQVEARHTLENCRQERDRTLSWMSATASLN